MPKSVLLFQSVETVAFLFWSSVLDLSGSVTKQQFLICDGFVEKPTTLLKERDKKDVGRETQG